MWDCTHQSCSAARPPITWTCLLVAGVGPAAAAAGRQHCGGCCRHWATRRCGGARGALDACSGGSLEPAHARQVRVFQMTLMLRGRGTRLCGTPPCSCGCTARILWSFAGQWLTSCVILTADMAWTPASSRTHPLRSRQEAPSRQPARQQRRRRASSRAHGAASCRRRDCRANLRMVIRVVAGNQKRTTCLCTFCVGWV